MRIEQTAPRALALIRVSQERDGMVSPEIQRRAVQQYCDRRGYDIQGWVEGIDESGSKRHSAWWPTLERAITDVERRRYEVLVVWKFSRIARNRLKWATAVHRVETVGGRIESATEDVDATTSVGRFTRGMLAELNVFFAEQIGDGWKEAHERRVASGRPSNGRLRYGYLYDLEAKLHRPDPVTGPALAEAYRQFAAGRSDADVATWLNEGGFRTQGGNRFDMVAVRRILDTGFASGRFLANGSLHDGIHEPLIDAATWAGYVAARTRWELVHRRITDSKYLYSGLVRCEKSGRGMNGGRFGQSSLPQYCCRGGEERGKLGACSRGYLREWIIDAALSEWMVTQEPSDAVTDLRRTLALEVSVSTKRDAIARIIGRIDVLHGRPKGRVTIVPVDEALKSTSFSFVRRHLRPVESERP